MASNIEVDDKQVQDNLKKLLKKAESGVLSILFGVAGEILRLSSFEVPHDTGLLQSSGGSEPDGQNVKVGYNKTYAARLHEHPEYHFQKGRKGKYLEDPIKKNMDVFLKFVGQGFKAEMGFK